MTLGCDRPTIASISAKAAARGVSANSAGRDQPKPL
jgi:hypothetical protein